MPCRAHACLHHRREQWAGRRARAAIRGAGRNRRSFARRRAEPTRWPRHFRRSRRGLRGRCAGRRRARPRPSDFIALRCPEVVIANGRNLSRRIDRSPGRPADFPRGLRYERRRARARFAPFVTAMKPRGRRPRRHRERRRIPRAAGVGRLFGVEGRGDRLSREPAHRAARHRSCRAHDLPGLHRHRDDGAQPLSMPFRLHADEAARRIVAPRAPPAILCAAVADGGRRTRAADPPRRFTTLPARAPRKPRQSGEGDWLEPCVRRAAATAAAAALA